MHASELTIKTDCYCEEYLNEIMRHYREGIEVKKLQAGDKVIFIKEWSNLCGTFVKVEKDGVQYDIRPKNIQP